MPSGNYLLNRNRMITGIDSIPEQYYFDFPHL